MKPQQMTVAASVPIGTDGGVAASVTHQTQTALNNSTHIRPVPSEPPKVAQRAGGRTHTLILTGELDRSSAHALEAAIERLCEEGVTGIRLDLRGLTHIDSIGVAVIGFRCGLCLRRGFEFALIPGSQFVQRVFEQAGVAHLLPFAEDEHDEQVASPRLPALVLSHRLRDDCDQ
jgi:anti-anti-sigma factor